MARYGEFVLLKPRFEPQTVLLWLLPPLALIGGGLALGSIAAGATAGIRHGNRADADARKKWRGWKSCWLPSRTAGADPSQAAER